MVKVDIIIPTDQEMNKTVFHSTSQAAAITTRTEAGMKHIGVGMAGTKPGAGMMSIPGTDQGRFRRPLLYDAGGPESERNSEDDSASSYTTARDDPPPRK